MALTIIEEIPLEALDSCFIEVCLADGDRLDAALAEYGASLARFAEWAGEQGRPGLSDIVSTYGEKVRELSVQGEALTPAVRNLMEEWQQHLLAHWERPEAGTAEYWLRLLASPAWPDPLAAEDLDTLGRMLALDEAECAGSVGEAEPDAGVPIDSLSARRALAQFLGDAGYRVRTALDGQEAIESLAGFRPDLVLTDLEMPRLNGVELARHLRAREEYRELPVVMITSRSTEKHRHEAEQAGVDLYLTKPYAEEALLLSLQALLGGMASR